MTFYSSQYPEFTDDYIQSLIWYERSLAEPEDIGYSDEFSRAYLQRRHGGLRDQDLIAKHHIPAPPKPKPDPLHHRPTFTFVSGVGGSGKSILLQPILRDGSTNPRHSEAIDPTALIINPDAIKRELGFQGGDGLPYHEQSMYIAEERLHVARLRRQSVVLVTTHKTPAYLNSKLVLFARSGYQLAGHHIGMDPHNAIRLANARRVAFGTAAPIISDAELLSNDCSYMNFVACRMALTDWTMRLTNSPSKHYFSGIDQRSVEMFISAAEDYVKEYSNITAADIQRDFLVDYYLARDMIRELVKRGHAKRIARQETDIC